jgi:hypothetical protein
MNRIKNNESGFSAVEIVMVIVIVGLIGAVGYLVYKNQHTTTKTVVVTKVVKGPTSSSSPSSIASNPYAGWKTYTLKYEKLTFKYPSDWTLSEYLSSTNASGSSQNTDKVDLSAPGVTKGNSTLSIEDGVNENNIPLSTSSLLYANPVNVKFIGNNNYLLFAKAMHPGLDPNSLGCSVLVYSLAKSSSDNAKLPVAKNAIDNNGNNNLYIVACETPGQTFTTTTVNQAIKDPVLQTNKLIIESMHY